VRSFEGYNYVVTTEGDQGMAWTTGASRALNKIIGDDRGFFHLIAQYSLPDGDHARLYFIQREDKTTG